MIDLDTIFGWVVRLWNSWDARVMVILSLAVQILLTILGSRRKFITGKSIKIIVWSVYLAADWVALVALGKLSEVGNKNSQQNVITYPTSDELRALWAPLLLLHLGGPDTITAYSLEDNRLWLRFLLGLAIQAGVTIYVISRCWTNSWRFMLTFPLILAGIIKYGERTWSLRSIVSKEGFSSIHKFLGGDSNLDELKKNLGSRSSYETARDLELLTVAYRLFDDLKFHIVNLVHKRWGKWSCSYSFSTASYKLDEVFKIIDFELGFIYDVLYTKASFIHTSAGSCLRFISFLCTASALCGFFLATKPDHATIDVTITYALLLGAVSLEVYAVILLIYSDWAILWLMKHHKKWLAARVLRFVAPRSLSKRRLWSNSMGQFNLLSYCIDVKPSKFRRILKYFGMNLEFKKMLGRIIKFFHTDEELVKYKHVDVPEELKKFILEMMKEAKGCRRQEETFPDGGKWALKRYQFERDLIWIFDSEITDFKESIVLWHIATDICYYSDDLANSRDSQSTNYGTPHLSKKLSDYMMYLLVICPNMLSFSSTETNFWKKARDEVKRKLEEGRLEGICEKELCRILMKEEPAVLSIGSIQRMEMGVLEDVQELADVLMKKNEGKWKVISRVWVEMLCHVACNCQVNFHAQQLSQGGEELVTYVWLLLLPLADHSGH